MQARAVGAERHATRRAAASRRPARGRIRASGSTRAVQHLDVVRGRAGRCSSSSTHTQCASAEPRRRPGRPSRGTRCCRVRCGVRTSATSSCCSEAWVWTSSPVSADSAADVFEQAARARHREARRERRAQAAAGRAVPARGRAQADSSSPRRGRLVQARRARRRRRPSGTCRRRRAARSAPAPRTPRRCRAPSPSSARWSCRRAAARRRPGAPRPRSEPGIVRGLDRPDPLAQPVQERQVVGAVRGTASGTGGRGSG